MLQKLLNKAAPSINPMEIGSESTREPTQHYRNYYDTLEIVNRVVNMIVDDAGGFLYDSAGADKKPRVQKVLDLLNFRPNPFMDSFTFKRNLVLDFVLDGNMFIYYDGVHIYQLPAQNITIEHDETQGPTGYKLGTDPVRYKPEEVIHIRDNGYSLYRGSSRLKACLTAMRMLTEMKAFQANFFNNGAVPGLVLSTEATLSDKIKERMAQAWKARFNPRNGGRNPVILDGGMKIDTVANVNFKELDFASGVATLESSIARSMGVPPLLLDGGNNANIKPNQRLYYVETILPIVKRIATAFSTFFNIEIFEDITEVLGMQPDLQEQASYLVNLVNGGIITPDEARLTLGKEPKGGEHDKLRVPQNIAGSAVNPSQGGRPKENNNDK